MMINNRKKYYTDFEIQGKLIFALVLLETLLVIAAISYLYYRFDMILDERLYSAHFSPEITLFQEFSSVFFEMTLALLAVNAVALFIAHIIWSNYVDRVLGTFRSLLTRISHLDLSTDLRVNNSIHPILKQLSTWIHMERQRSLRLRSMCSNLDTETSTEAIKSTLAQIQSLLAASPIIFIDGVNINPSRNSNDEKLR